MKKIIYIFILIVFGVGISSASDFTVKKLPSGQTVIIKEIKRNPIVTIDTWIRTGSVDEDEKTSGIAHFLEHLFFKGTEKYPTGMFDKMIESKGGVTNAATSKDFTHYYITIPSKNFKEALMLHADMLTNPMIPRHELEKERLVVLEEISKGLDSTSSILSNNLFKVMYKNHPYERPVIGSAKIIENVTREEILDFYHKNYYPDNTTTVIVGDVDTGEAISLIEEYFKYENQDNKIQKDYPRIKPTDLQEREVKTKKNVETGYMILAYRTDKMRDKKDLYALDVLSVILGESQSSRLNQRLKKQKNVVYSIDSSSGALKLDGFFEIEATFKPENLNIVKKEIDNEIQDLKNITDEEVLIAKNYIKTQSYYERETTYNVANTVGYLSIFFDNTKFYKNYDKNIDKITKKDVLNVLNKYLLNPDKYESIVLPEKFDEKKILDANSIETTKTALKNKKLQKKDLKTSNVNYEIAQKTGDTTKYKMEKGETVTIRQNRENSIVAIKIAAVGGNFIESIPNTASLTARGIKDGTLNYSGEEISKLLDERGIGLSFVSSGDLFEVTIQTTKNELDDAFVILDELIQNAEFKEEDINKNKKQIKASLERLSDNPLSYTVDRFKGEAFKGSVYGNNSKVLLRNIDKVKRENILAYYNKIFSPNNLHISVVGNVNDKEILNYISNIFDKKSAQNKIDIKTIDYKKYMPSSNEEHEILKKDVNTSWLLLGYKTCDIYNTKERAAIKIIDSILGSGMSSRLFRNLRDDRGLAYAVGSSIIQNYKDGVFLTYIGTAPSKIKEAKAGMLDEINKIKTQYVTQEELKEAKEKILGNLVISIETNMDEASLLNTYSILGFDINYLEEHKKLIESITPSDVLSTANKYFSNPYIYTIIKP